MISMTSAIFRLRTLGGGLELPLGVCALALACAVYYIDTFTEIEGAIAVLYVVVTLLASQLTTRLGLVVVAAVCAALTMSSYLITHSDYTDLQALVRLNGALAALVITTVLLLKTETARLSLLSINSALRASEGRYRSIFDRTRVALWERDYSRLRAYLFTLKAEGVGDIKSYARQHDDFVDHCIGLITVVASNEAARDMFGPAGASIGALRRSITPGPDKFLNLLQVIMDEGRVFEDKVEVEADNGDKKLVLLSISFPEDPEAFDRVVVSMVDITQREMALKALTEAQAEMARASRAATIGAMSASLAHELNQPLGAIGVNAQTLLRWLDRDPPDLKAVSRSAERIIRDSQRASEIIQNTRGLLSQAEGKMETIHLDTLIKDTLALIDHDLQRTGTFVNFLPKEIPPVTAVKIELQQVLINLITNALQAMEEAASAQRTITLATDRIDEARISITVRDSGPGITDKIKDKLFSPFFTTKPTGMGMGLSICRSTIEARGGRLDGGNHPDGGAVFKLHLFINPEVAHA